MRHGTAIGNSIYYEDGLEKKSRLEECMSETNEQIFELEKLMHGISIGNIVVMHNLVLAKVQHVIKLLIHMQFIQKLLVKVCGRDFTSMSHHVTSHHIL